MSIERQGDFLIWPDAACGEPMIGLESGQMDRCIEEVQRRGSGGVFGSPSWGFDEPDLDALARISSLRHVWFWDVKLDSLEGLYSHPGLRYFGLHGRRPALECDRFEGLRTVSIDWRARDRGLSEQREVQEYLLWHHKPRTKSMRGLETPATCQRVEFNWTNVTSMEGLAGLAGTQWLEIHRSRNLESLSGVEVLRDTLKKVIITTCGRLHDLTALDDLPHLELAIVDGERYVG